MLSSCDGCGMVGVGVGVGAGGGVFVVCCVYFFEIFMQRKIQRTK